MYKELVLSMVLMMTTICTPAWEVSSSFQNRGWASFCSVVVLKDWGSAILLEQEEERRISGVGLVWLR
jgi:hypothetical protein